MKNLESLGREIARQQDEQMRTEETVSLVTRQLEWKDEPSALRPILQTAAVVALLVASAVVWRVKQNDALVVETPGIAIGQWHTAQTQQPISFNDGSSVLVSGGSRVKIASLSEAGASVILERGRATVSIPHHDHTRWLFEVGPFTIHVVGTRFDASWDPASETFDLVMHDGIVKLDGPQIGRAQVVAGQSIEVKLAAMDTKKEPVLPVESAMPPKARPQTRATTWKTLLLRRDYAAGLAAARSVGWESLLTTASADELLLLGDAGRFTHDAKAAQSAYLAVRARFGNSHAAGVATFFLGRVAFELNDLSQAASWFTKYREQFPSGPFAAEALGRQIEVAIRTNPAIAQTLAREYLATWPEGAHARLARSVVTP